VIKFLIYRQGVTEYLLFDRKTMTPGPTLIMKAPGCRNPVKFSTIGSGNTFGATFWTDGKCEAPMLPDEPWLRKSPSEGILFWSDECEEIGQLDFFSGGSEKPEWKDLDYAEEPSEDDYNAALHSGVASTPEKERYIRMRLWWRGNDHIRRGDNTELSEAHLENLRRFEAILSEEDDNQRLMKAEVLRQLSRYDEALHLLNSEFPDDYSHAVLLIRDLASRSDCKVAELT
jgi:hypothetical protein